MSEPSSFQHHSLPVYYADLWIGCLPQADYISKTKKACKEVLGYDFDDGDVESASLLAYRGSKFILAFRKGNCGIEKIAHEVFHLTHRLMDLCGCNFDAGHHEQGAYLHGWLMELVWNSMKGTK